MCLKWYINIIFISYFLLLCFSFTFPTSFFPLCFFSNVYGLDGRGYTRWLRCVEGVVSGLLFEELVSLKLVDILGPS